MKNTIKQPYVLPKNILNKQNLKKKQHTVKQTNILENKQSNHRTC